MNPTVPRFHRAGKYSSVFALDEFRSSPTSYQETCGGKERVMKFCTYDLCSETAGAARYGTDRGAARLDHMNVQHHY